MIIYLVMFLLVAIAGGLASLLIDEHETKHLKSWLTTSIGAVGNVEMIIGGGGVLVCLLGLLHAALNVH